MLFTGSHKLRSFVPVKKKMILVKKDGFKIVVKHGVNLSDKGRQTG
jgi:hypothetical protein